jgi:hypothetical protein
MPATPISCAKRSTARSASREPDSAREQGSRAPYRNTYLRSLCRSRLDRLERCGTHDWACPASLADPEAFSVSSQKHRLVDTTGIGANLLTPRRVAGRMAPAGQPGVRADSVKPEGIG